MDRLRYLSVAVLSAAIVIFASQNATTGVTVSFLFWQFEISGSLLVLVPFLAGLLIGLLSTFKTYLKQRRAGRRREAEEAERVTEAAPAAELAPGAPGEVEAAAEDEPEGSASR